MAQSRGALATRPGLGRLAGRTAVVVGGGSDGAGIGNGRAASIILAREGADVAVVDANTEAANRTVELIRAEGGRGTAHTADATSDANCRAVVEAVARTNGGIDVLVNNVGVVGTRTSVVDVDLDECDTVMRLNVKSMMLMSRHVIPRMAEGGSVVNVASIAGLVATERALYSASKAAVIGLTNTMASQHGPDGIRVNAVCPGSVWTPLVENLTDSPEQIEDLRAARRNGNMLHREGTAWDVAYAILFLAGDEAPWITSQLLIVDGGQGKRFLR